jgi:metal-dependent amidase/aminoacylase/carboxypeptidase family protein
VATDTASAAGATATFELAPDPNPVVVNEPALTTRAAATLTRVAGEANVTVIPYLTVSEDFAYYARQVPSFFYFVGATPRGQDPQAAPSNHSPKFFLDEGSLPLGVRTLTALALDYLQGN